jgi:predicted nucleic acid-binding protein
VRIYFADSSAIVRSFLSDEPDFAAVFELLIESGNAVLASQLADVEVAKGLAAAHRQGRIDDQRFEEALDWYQRAPGLAGAIRRIPLDPLTIIPRARQIVLHHPVKTLDALQLAVADTDGRALAEDDELVFVTRDSQQRAVAEALGMATA